MHCGVCGGRYYENGDDGDVPGTGHNDGDDDDKDQKHVAHPDLHSPECKRLSESQFH